MKKTIILISICIILIIAGVSCADGDTVDTNNVLDVTTLLTSEEANTSEDIETAEQTEAPTEAVVSTEGTTTEQIITTDTPTTEKITTEAATTVPVTTSAPSGGGGVYYPSRPSVVTTEAITTEPVTTEEATTEALTTEAVTTEEVTTEEVTTEEVTTEAVTTNYEIELFSDKATKYTIVYDKTDSAAKKFASELTAKFASVFKITFEAKDNETLSTPTEREIIIGNARDGADAVYSKMGGTYDFAVEVQENKLLLNAKNEISYNYLLEYVSREVFSKASGGTLKLSSADSIVYSTSEIKDITYAEYWRSQYDATAVKNMDLSIYQDFVLKMTEPRSFTDSTGKTIVYRFHLPFNYDPSKEYPVLVYLHGAGHRGSDNVEPVKGGAFSSTLRHTNLMIDDAIIIAPQCPSGEQWVDYSWSKGNYSTSAVAESKAMKCTVELIKSVIKNYAADDDRVYVFGLSMGGYGTWDLVTRHTDIFAGALMLCGGGDPSAAAQNLVDLPIWAFHGDADPSVSVENTRALVKAIRDAGGTKIKYDEYAGKNHSIGSLTTSRDEVFEWLFSQSK